ncbi:CPBP family intramembrane metalloprotease [Hungatella sp. L12]|uniref:CPBP family intramembrane metalloprotease n=1 Tax=Hungatella hominis TaxID=2763050 RepID=A0ABR7H6N8_9FIRM|nr:CPBP family intramembrane glutamic endopeptidase [Hungatella hominis]MBC5708837.1 CPBP family intramembrane metalloprotease [Hungatella hominis]
MSRLWDNKLIKNRFGQVRSGWIILFAMAAFYILAWGVSDLFIRVLRQILIGTGDINLTTGEYSSLVDWLDEVSLPVAIQMITDLIMLIIPIAIWRLGMKRSVRELGLSSLGGKQNRKDGAFGMMLGVVNCSVIFLLVITIGKGRVVSDGIKISVLGFWWLLTFILVGVAEEVMNRGFLMGVLRRCRNLPAIMVVPSVIFGLIHLRNPGVTFFSVTNIVLVGILFSYMFIKSGSIWMCIGYHITWNIFQGLVYGMPVSGLHVPGMITTQYTESNVLNGGAFGIEGGILTTIVTLLTFIGVWYYYRNSKYDFVNQSEKPDAS